ncbi:MAG: Rrf2 family transcriptional regulator [Actinomycetia bacterium]|nr:Rrf2 family transcriptional regulator [Actinomycetes bacterium]
MKLITRDTDYAIRALVYMAKHSNQDHTVKQLAEILDIPQPFLRKILQQLANGNILDSTRGKGGGFSLARPAEDIYLLDIMDIFQGKFELLQCIFNKDICGNIKDCLLRKKIMSIKNYVQKQLENITIKQLIEEK